MPCLTPRPPAKSLVWKHVSKDPLFAFKNHTHHINEGVHGQDLSEHALVVCERSSARVPHRTAPPWIPKLTAIDQAAERSEEGDGARLAIGNDA